MKDQSAVSIKQKGRIGNLCLYAFVFITLVIFLYRYDRSMFIIRYLFLIVGALLGYWRCIRKAPVVWQPIAFLFAICVCWLLTYFGKGMYINYEPSDLLYTVCYIGLSIVLLDNKYNHWITLLLYGFGAGTILLRIVQSVSMNSILLANSRNYISVLLLMVLLFYYISCHDKNRSYLVTPVILYFFASIYATGRGGIVCGAFLTISLCVYKVIHMENKWLKRLLWLVIMIVSLISLIYFLQLDEIVLHNFLTTNFSRFYIKGVNDTARESIWSMFFSNNQRSIGDFIFGSDASLIVPDGNLHNSFIQAYASFGLLGFLLITILVVKNIVRSIKTKDILFIILFFSLIIRAFTDRLFFQGYCEVFLYYFIFYPYYNRSNRYQREGST